MRLVKNNADQQQGYELRNWSYIYEFMDVMYNNFRVDRSHAQDAQSHRYAVRVTKIAKLVRETIVSRKSGSAFDQWVEMGALEPDTRQELAVLEAHSIPKCSKYLTQAKNHTLELDAMLDMLEVRLITIEPHQLQ